MPSFSIRQSPAEVCQFQRSVAVRQRPVTLNQQTLNIPHEAPPKCAGLPAKFVARAERLDCVSPCCNRRSSCAEVLHLPNMKGPGPVAAPSDISMHAHFIFALFSSYVPVKRGPVDETGHTGQVAPGTRFNLSHLPGRRHETGNRAGPLPAEPAVSFVLAIFPRQKEVVARKRASCIRSPVSRGVALWRTGETVTG